MKLNVPGEEYVITSNEFLEYTGEHLPEKIVFVGGGYISLEFAHVAARAGAKVTILHRGKRPLEHFDPDASKPADAEESRYRNHIKTPFLSDKKNINLPYLDSSASAG